MLTKFLSFFHVFRTQEAEAIHQLPKDSSQYELLSKAMQNLNAIDSESSPSIFDINTQSTTDESHWNGVKKFFISVNKLFLKKPDKQFSDLSAKSKESNVIKAPIRLSNLKEKAMIEVDTSLHQAHANNTNSDEQQSALSKVHSILSDVWHISSNIDGNNILASYDISALIAVIRNLKEKVGLSEFGVMILMGIIVKNRL
jgi:hypothetical protein